MSYNDDGDYRRWKQAVGLSLGIDDEPDDLTSQDYPDCSDERPPMADELRGLPSPDDEVLPFDLVGPLDQ